MSNPEYQPVANKKDLREGDLLRAELFGKPLELSMVNGKVYALDAVCSHKGGPLEEDTLQGYEVECHWHGPKFDVMTGEVTNPPTEIPQLSYEVKVENDKILASIGYLRTICVNYYCYELTIYQSHLRNPLKYYKDELVRQCTIYYTGPTDSVIDIEDIYTKPFLV